MYMYMYIYCVCMCVCVCVYISMCVWMYVCVYICVYIYVYCTYVYGSVFLSATKSVNYGNFGKSAIANFYFIKGFRLTHLDMGN